MCIRDSFSSFAFGYWRGASGTGAWLRTLSVIGLILCSLAVQIGINQWHAKFFNALQNKDGEALFHYALLFLGLLAAGVAVAVAMVVARIGLQIAWRRWLTSTPVSYTHLDVYKRQLQWTPALNTDHSQPALKRGSGRRQQRHRLL